MIQKKKPVIWAETIFDTLYLVIIVILGIIFLVRADNNLLRQLFAIMALLLFIGDSFHLIPRIISYFTIQTAGLKKILDIGKCITSITMTLFYVILSYAFFEYYQYTPPAVLLYTIWTLAVLRIALCIYPIRQWTSDSKNIFYNILRNIPFTILGLIVLILFLWKSGGEANPFNFMWLAILLSFIFYLPVVIFASRRPKIGMLMLPKTCMYVWILAMGLWL